MASSMNGTFDEMISSMHRCKLCEQPTVNPLQPSCLHVLCERCVMYLLYANQGNLNENQNDYSIHCPECKKTVTIGCSDIGAAMKPSNISSILFQCLSCTKDTYSVFRCEYCEKPFCFSCFRDHSYVTCTQNTKKIITCVEHSMECKYYCYKCDILVCVFCLMRKHDDHHFVSITEAENVVRHRIQKRLENGKVHADQCYATISCLMEVLADFRSKHAFEQAELTSTFQSFMKICDSFYDGATKDLNAIYSKQENNVKALQDEIEIFASMINDSCKTAKKLFMEADSYALCKHQATFPAQFPELHSISPIEMTTLPENLEEKTVEMVLNSFHEKMRLGVDAFAASIDDIATFAEAESNLKLPIGNECFSSSTNHFKRTLPIFMKHRFGALGKLNLQFYNPNGFCLNTNDDIIITDMCNHCIQIFQKDGTFKFKFGMPGKMEGFLWLPSKVAIIRNDNRLVVADQGIERLRLQIFSENGIFIKRIPFFHVSIAAAIRVTNDGHIVIVDKYSAFAFIVKESGEVIRCFECRNYVVEPSDIAVDGAELFICDYKAKCVAVFSMDGVFQRYIGNGDVSYPSGILVTESEVFVSDSDNARFHVARFARNGLFKASYVCSAMKVTHCHGFKMNSNGDAFTLSEKHKYMLAFDKKTFEQQL